MAALRGRVTNATPAALEQRFEAVILGWEGTAVADRTSDANELRDLVEGLCAAGMDVAVVSGTHVDDVDRQLAARPHGPGRLHLLVNEGSEVFRAEAEGLRLLHRRVTPANENCARWIYRDLWARGVSPGLVLIVGAEFSSLGGVPGTDSPMLIPELARATAASVGVEPAGVPEGVIKVGGGPDRLRQLLHDQLVRRERGDVPVLDPDPAWTFVIDGIDPQAERAHEALLTLADGAIGTSGAPPGRHRSATPRVLAAGFYSRAAARSELAACPVWTALPFDHTEDGALRRTLDLRHGILHQEVDTGDGKVDVLQFSSLDRPGTVALRATGPEHLLLGGPVLQPPRGRSWGSGRQDDAEWIRVVGSHDVLTVAATERVRPGGLDRFATYRRGGAERAIDDLGRAADAGFDTLLAEHRARWAARWANADIVIRGDDELQRSTRFALFHLMAQVGDRGEAAVGARGTTGPAYRGHVFWDADVFVLPFLAATHPQAARSMLMYRINRLPAALDAAAASGRRGARFPWESAADGSDVTPSSVRDFSGRIVPIRTRTSEEHVIADIAWAADCYVSWSGDEAFAQHDGKKLWVETARYWTRRIRMHDGAAHIYGVVGPDEYHEAVDDNAYTNVMARWNLRRAAAVDDVDPHERRTWHELADALVDGYEPSTGIYEQFAGFHGLQPLVIAEIAPRPVVADVLLGRDVVRDAQVIKQTDVLMLHHLVPEEVAPNSLVPNLEFYEPRTAHGSSLSPGIHAALFARASRPDDGLPLLELAVGVDLDDNTATTAGGLHLAAMGAAWQALAFGYAGARVESGALHVAPRLPRAWESLEIHLRFRGAPVTIRASHDGVTVDGHARVVVDA